MTEGFGLYGDTREIEVNDNVCKLLIDLNTDYEGKFMEHCGLLELFCSLKSRRNCVFTSGKGEEFVGMLSSFWASCLLKCISRFIIKVRFIFFVPHLISKPQCRQYFKYILNCSGKVNKHLYYMRQ